MKKHFRLGIGPLARFTLSFFLFCFTAVYVSAQTKSIKGVVTNEKGEPLAGATVSVASSKKTTITDNSGAFELGEIKGSEKIVVSFTGFTTQTINVNEQSDFSIKLSAVNASMNEVIVVGYGTKRKRDLTGSVASIGASDIRSTPIIGVNQALQGRMSGVQVTQASNAPGGGVQVRIRGGNSISASNEPLYVVDGFPIADIAPASGPSNGQVYSNVLATINPADIQSIEVLKDASATSIYGSRGANGVVLITTKRGKEGSPLIEFDTYFSTSRITKTMDMTNAAQSLELKNLQLVNLGRPPRYGTDPAFGPKKPEDYLPGTDWQELVFRDALAQNYQLTVSGGNQGLRYLISGNYLNQDGIIINNNFKRYATRINLDSRISKTVNVGMNLTASRIDNNGVNDNSTGLTGNASGVTSSPVQTTLTKTPAQQVYNADGTYTLTFDGMGAIVNPVALLNTTTNFLQTDRILGNLFTDIKIAEGLTARISAGADISNSRNRVFYTPQTLVASSQNGIGGVGNATNTNLLNENTLNYVKQLGQDHDLDLLAGITFQKNKDNRTYTEAQDFPNYSLGANNLAFANRLVSSSGSINEWGLTSYLARANYRFKERYLLTVTGRIDGSSKFGANNKYGFFPSGAFAWRVSDEPFMKDVSSISDLKFRVSYGQTGNEGIGLYQSLSRYGSGQTVFNNVQQLFTEAAGAGNNDLKWEKTAQFDVGVDFGILNNRIQITADYYIKTTEDLLLSVQLPATAGFTSALRNVGSVENKGWEASINAAVIAKPNFQWNISGNVSHNENKVLKLADADQFFVGSESEVIVRVGEPLGSIYGVVFDGIWQSQSEITTAGKLAIPGALPGAPRFKDVNDDKEYNQASDRTIVGFGLPKYTFGFTSNLTYKNFDLSIFLQGVQGNDVYNNTRRIILGGDPGSNQLKEYYDNFWRADRPSNRYFAPRQWQIPASDYWVEDGSFLRIKNVMIGYRIPVKTKFIKQARVYISGQNLHTFTNYTGFDPEVNSNFNSNTQYGFDFFAYPAARTFTLGANLKF